MPRLAQPSTSLAFRLVPASGADVARVAWDGESPWTAADLLRATTESAPPGAVGEVRAWLRERLSPGPRPAMAMQEEAAADGFSPMAVKRARRLEGIVARKSRTYHGVWTWALPGYAGKGDHPTHARTS